MIKGISVVCPSSSIPYVTSAERKLAERRFRGRGYNVKFGQFIDSLEWEDRSSIQNRCSDFRSALEDTGTNYILAGTGGFHTFELLDYLDFNLIKKLGKSVIGFSDITTLQNAIYHLSGICSYSGPNFAMCGMVKGFEYIENNLFNALNNNKVIYEPSSEWSDDEWYLDQNNRNFVNNVGPYVIRPGNAEGVLLGGNVSSLALLQGTQFMPSLTGSILLIEEDAASGHCTLDIMIRQLRSIIYSSGKPSAMLIGRFPQKAMVTKNELIRKMLQNFQELEIPILADFDLGHVPPIFTFPIGGYAKISSSEAQINFSVTDYK